MWSQSCIIGVWPSQDRHHYILIYEMGKLPAITMVYLSVVRKLRLSCWRYLVLSISDIRKYVYYMECVVTYEMLVPFLKTQIVKDSSSLRHMLQP